MKTKLLALLGLMLSSSLMHSQTQPTKPDYIGELQLVTVTPSLSSKMDELVSTPTTSRIGTYWRSPALVTTVGTVAEGLG